MKPISVFEFSFVMILLMPVLCLLIYASTGYFINFNSLNFIFFILLLFVFPGTLKFKTSSQNKFFASFFVANIGALLGHLINGEGVFEFLRTFSAFYFFIIIGWLLYFLYYKQGKLKKITKLFIRAGLFIATVNLIQYILLNTDDLIIGNYSITYDRYEQIINYTTELNKALADYVIIGYEDGQGLRPLGFFYDLHSQYYFPLLAIILIFFTKNQKTTRKDVMLMIYLLVTIFLSGIKSAILTIALLLLFLYVFSENKRKYTKYVIVGVVLAGSWAIKKIVDFLNGSGALKEMAQLWDHVITLPYKLFVSYPITFFIGGSPSLRLDPDFYSEIYWVSILFYIGLIGFLVYIRGYKTYYLSKYKSNVEAFYVFLLFAFSLMHYSVYNSGVNCFASGLVFMYLFIYYEKSMEIKNKKKLKDVSYK